MRISTRGEDEEKVCGREIEGEDPTERKEEREGEGERERERGGREKEDKADRGDE